METPNKRQAAMILALELIVVWWITMAPSLQKHGGNAMHVDEEHAFDLAYSKALGVDTEKLIVCQPNNGEIILKGKVQLVRKLVELAMDR